MPALFSWVLALVKLDCCSHASLLLLFVAGINLSRLLLSDFLGLEVSPGNTTGLGAPEDRSQKRLGWQEGCRHVAALDCPWGQFFCTHTAGGQVTYEPLQQCPWGGWEEVSPETVSLTNTPKTVYPSWERGEQKTCPHRQVLVSGTTMHHSSNSQSCTGFLSLILKADPWWVWFVPWGDCSFLLIRDDPYFVHYMSYRKAISIGRSLESKQSHLWLNLALAVEFSLEEPYLLTETNHKVRGKGGSPSMLPKPVFLVYFC